MQTKYHGLRAWMLMGTLLGSASMAAGSAQAQQEGLVNVNIQNVTVQIPVGVAANICDVAVSALAQAITMGPTQCRAGTIALADDSDGEAPPVDQNGLINVNIQNVDAQVPISVAANICGVAVNVLASDLDLGPVDCNAFGRAATVSS
jgi:hypothetical protein